MQAQLYQFLILALYDLLFLACCGGAIVLLAAGRPVTYAVLKRNFISYFSNPTGYLFVMLFVFLCSLAQFWPHEFFNNNLADLNQLSLWYPAIMLLFVPAITMSIWADERRQGTDELLLTIPADDFDIVIGKFLAIAAIFTAALLYSQIAIYLTLNSLTLGKLDTGLFVTTYFGYWQMGLAMLALGMAVSFLTNNVTVSFVLSALINLPLVAAARSSSVLPKSSWEQALSQWSLEHQSQAFGRGVFGLSSILYFGMLTIIGLYLCMLFIGRRHWLAGRDGKSLLIHSPLRLASLVAITVSANLVLVQHLGWVQLDATEGKVNTIAPETRQLLRDLDPKHPINVEVFISDNLPETYAQTKTELLSLLDVFDGIGGKHIDVNVHDGLEVFGQEATRAEEMYGIEAVSVSTSVRGAEKQEDVLMGAAFTSGPDSTVVVKFFDLGVPVEYELVRSLVTVAKKTRLRMGLVSTDANLMGGMDMQSFSTVPKQLILEELEKQYTLVEVDANHSIDETLDVLLVVQPSSLSPPQLNNLISAIDRGVPTAIFEDPFPNIIPGVQGTDQPRQSSGGGMFGGGQPPEPKGDIRILWDRLGIEPVGAYVDEQGRRLQAPRRPGDEPESVIISQQYNPYPKVRGYPLAVSDEWVFVDAQTPQSSDPLNYDHDSVAGVQQLLFFFTGAIRTIDNPLLEFTPLVTTGMDTSSLLYSQIRGARGDMRVLSRFRTPSSEKYIIAARIRSTGHDDEEENKEEEESPNLLPGPHFAEEAENSHSHEADDHHGHSHDNVASDIPRAPSSDRKINVTYVADIDVLASIFLQLRNRPDPTFNWRFDNGLFVLNVIDELAGEERFIPIRQRQRQYITLENIERLTEVSRKKSEEQMQAFQDRLDEAERKMAAAQADFQDRLDEESARILEELGAGEQPSLRDQQIALTRAILRLQNDREKNQDAAIAALETFERESKENQRDLDLELMKIQSRYKFGATAIPPLPLILIGLVVLILRRVREREGVSTARRR